MRSFTCFQTAAGASRATLLLLSCAMWWSGCEGEKGTASPSRAHTRSTTSRAPESKLPATPTLRTPQSPTLAIKALDSSKGASFTLGQTTTALAGVGRQRCRLGDAIQTITIDEKTGMPQTRSFLVHARADATGSPRKLIVTTTHDEHVATLEQKEGLTTLRFDQVQLTYPTTHDWLLADEHSSASGCFHTGTFTLSPGDRQGPVTGVRVHATESFVFHVELSETHALSVMVYMPIQRFESEKTIEADLANVFADPRSAIVRVFFEERKTLQDIQGVERDSWTQTPARDGMLSVTFEGTSKRPLARLSLKDSSMPADWSYPLPKDTKLSLEARTAIITDPRGKLVPPPPAP